MTAENDKELLDLAAKSVGIEYTGDGYARHSIGNSHYDNYPWNPLEDDTDAFRLTCTLGLSVDINNAFYKTTVIYESGDEIIEDHKLGTAPATRLAIVKAAAEIGRNLK